MLELRQPATSLTVGQLAAGPVLIVAPHADDETLACGGLIAQLGAAGQAYAVALVSDGTGSHPRSRTHNAAQRRAVREAELVEALGILTDGHAPPVHFLRFPDTRVPRRGQHRFGTLVQAIDQLLRRYRPATVVSPWRRDPHGDHRATTEAVLAALAATNNGTDLLEYPVWVYEIAESGDAPRTGEVQCLALDVRAQLPLKKRAIRAHRSQLDRRVFDDPDGFCLTESMLSHFDRPHEYYYRYPS